MSQEKEFDEVEHWLNYIDEWRSTHKEPVPERLLDLLEEALEKSLEKKHYKKKNQLSENRNSLH